MNGQSANNPQLEQVEKELLSRYNDASNDSERSLLLGALGNAGSHLSWDVIKDSYSESSSHIKGRMLTSLRFVPGGDVADFVMTELRSNKSEAVRLAAVNALKPRKINENLVILWPRGMFC